MLDNKFIAAKPPREKDINLNKVIVINAHRPRLNARIVGIILCLPDKFYGVGNIDLTKRINHRETERRKEF
jgi:hypothetical protein